MNEDVRRVVIDRRTHRQSTVITPLVYVQSVNYILPSNVAQCRYFPNSDSLYKVTKEPQLYLYTQSNTTQLCMYHL